MRKLFLIPARGGSKGLPRKNVLPLAGRPLIEYTIDAAKGAMEEGDELCVSTDDPEIIQVVEDYGIKTPFVRPAELASDKAGSEEVIRHALDWYKEKEQDFDVVVLLQVTSPLRNANHVKEAISSWYPSLDMVVSVKETESNPYYVLFEEDPKGFLQKSKNGEFTRRQDCPKVYEYNGAIYIISVEALQEKKWAEFNQIKKYVMNSVVSQDIDSELDLIIIKALLDSRLSL